MQNAPPSAGKEHFDSAVRRFFVSPCLCARIADLLFLSSEKFPSTEDQSLMLEDQRAFPTLRLIAIFPTVFLSVQSSPPSFFSFILSLLLLIFFSWLTPFKDFLSASKAQLFLQEIYLRGYVLHGDILPLQDYGKSALCKHSAQELDDYCGIFGLVNQGMIVFLGLAANMQILQIHLGHFKQIPGIVH